MSATAGSGNDTPSFADEVVTRAADTVRELRGASAGPTTGAARAERQDARPGSCTPPPSAASPVLVSPTSRRQTSGKTAGGTGEDSASDESISRCLVYCRLRPSTKRDFQDGATNIVAMPDGRRVVIKDERHYDYDGTFGADTTQEQIFSAVAVPCVQHAFKGFCSALMCYGQTGTGKSFTMCNTDPAHAGIIPRAAKLIYETIAAADDGRCYTVVGQFVQIYRDHLGDLMENDGKDRVDIHYDRATGVSLTGCSSHPLANEDEFLRFYAEGNARRVVTATAMNPESSRGHTAMVVYVFSEDPNDPMVGRTRGKVTFIDLAGYERFSKTGITSDNPIMKDEAKTINASLLALGHVVSSLSSGSKHIPWRDSKLTRILQDSIGGRSRTSIILTIGPSSNHLFETTNSLQFGLRAMAVKVEAKVSITVDYEKLASKLQGLLDERDARINVLELQIASRDAERQELLDRYQQDRANLEQQFQRELQALTDAGATEEQIRKLREVHNVEVQNLQEQQAEELDYQDEVHSKEITKLINEQKHEEAKSLTALRIAQESIVEDFQRKLEHAREGTNDDLIHALQQLSEKDAMLASRASDTARLHTHLKTLADQVRSLGGEPPIPEAAFPQTYLDIAQVEEIKSRLDGEVGRLRNKVVDLQTQLDRITLICSDRNEQISCLMEENQKVHEKLRQTGAEMTDSTEELQRLKAKRAEVVDSTELETLRLRMQSEIDDLTSQRDALRSELVRALDEQKATAAASSVTPRNTPPRPHRRESQPRRRSGLPEAEGSCADLLSDASFTGDDLSDVSSVYPATPSRSPTRRRRSTNPFSKMNCMRNVYRRQAKKLTAQLTRCCAEKNVAQQRVLTLEALLEQHDVALPPCRTKDVSATSLPVQGAAILPTDSPTARASSSSPVTPSQGDPTDPDLALILSIRDEESAAQDRIMLDQERLLNQIRSSQVYNAELVSTLTSQLQAAGIAVQEPALSFQPCESLPVEDYMALLRDLRQCNRRMILHLLLRYTEQLPTDGGASLTDEQVTVETELIERDNQLELKDELLLEKSTMAQHMAKITGRLISQMETLGLTPCCSLPNTYQQVADVEVGQLEVQTEKQKALEEKLQREEEEKVRMGRLLNALGAEREHQALILRQTEAKNKELEERESRTAQTIHRLAEEKTQKEKMLEEAARRATRELMETQARLAQSESQRKSSVFDRIFGRLLD